MQHVAHKRSDSGDWVNANDWIMTSTGRKVRPLALRAEDVCIKDIAHALALKCRYGGHCREFYSVAQHSVLVSRYVPQQHALWGLLHDAEEAYLADIPRPVKPRLKEWPVIAAKVQAVICHRFKLDEVEPAEVKAIDTAILYDEMKVLMPPADWGRTDGLGLGINIYPASPITAESQFLSRFQELTT